MKRNFKKKNSKNAQGTNSTATSTETKNAPADPMTGLITAGTITQADADAIKAAMDSARESGKTMKEVLAGLVTAGTITQAKADAVLAAAPADNGKGGPQGQMQQGNSSGNRQPGGRNNR